MTTTKNVSGIVFAPGDTRSSAAERLEGLGIKGPAAELLLKEGAHLRHKARVEQARTAAMAAAVEILGGNTWEEELNVVVQFLGLLDAAGLGGCSGLEGIASVRYPAFAHLGKGRKQATDGRAWSAAIAEATISADQIVVTPCEGTLEVGILGIRECEGPNGQLEIRNRVSIDPSNPALVCGLRWLEVVAAEGLRKSAGLSPMNFLVDRVDAIPLADFLAEATPVEWSQVYNVLNDALEEKKTGE